MILDDDDLDGATVLIVRAKKKILKGLDLGSATVLLQLLYRSLQFEPGDSFFCCE